MFQPRPYQKDAIEAAKAELVAGVDPCLIEAATGAGKSLLVAYLAEWLHARSGGKRVLCLAPSKELVKQNFGKYVALGAKASIFSASAGAKSTRYPVVFGSPLTVKNAISRFRDDYCAVILDEAHNLTPTIRAIIDAMRDANPRLRVVGMTATPFRMGTGYIYRVGPDGRANGDDTCRDPYFTRLVYRIGARNLIEAGYLTPPVVGALHAVSYDTSGLVLRPNGRFDEAAVDAAFVGHGRKTAAIVGDVVAQAVAGDRKGVVFFAATVEHAREILASLPPALSALVTGESKDRDASLKAFAARKIKYIVNVGVLTTGWDCEHVDLIAILRKTESVGLLQQIIGRGLRLCSSGGKEDCLILDYAENIETHCPSGDLFAPKVKAKGNGGGSGEVEAECPQCGHINEFSRHRDAEGYQLDKHGYCLDVFGQPIVTDFGPMSGHYGRRCFGMIRIPGNDGKHDRCTYRWVGKDCPNCGEVNDIAARYCYVCKGEIVDPNERLVADFRALKKDPTQPQTDEVISMEAKESVSQRGNPTIRVDWKTPFRQFSIWIMPNSPSVKGRKDYAAFQAATQEGTLAPRTISYVKNREDQFYRILAYNQPIDELPDPGIKVKLNLDDGSHVCNSCGGPRSKYSSGVCNECYREKKAA